MVPEASCPMTMGGRRRPVLPSIPWTSLPQMPHAWTFTSTSFGPTVGLGHVGDLELLVFGENEGLHGALVPTISAA